MSVHNPVPVKCTITVHHTIRINHHLSGKNARGAQHHEHTWQIFAEYNSSLKAGKDLDLCTRRLKEFLELHDGNNLNLINKKPTTEWFANKVMSAVGSNAVEILDEEGRRVRVERLEPLV